MVCKRFHVERPSSATSGGQSDGRSCAVAVRAGGLVAAAVVEGCFAMDLHEAMSVQERHLLYVISSLSHTEPEGL